MSSVQPEGYLATPQSGKGHPVLVLHAWWGLNDTMKAFCRRLAEAGFLVFAPDLYHGKIADTIAGAETLGRALDEKQDQAMAEIREAVKFLKQRSGESDRGVTVIGFSLGAYYALNLAVTAPDEVQSVVIFYGTGVSNFTDAKATFLGHFAENDEFEPKEYVDGLETAIQQAGRSVTFYRYPGTGHWFFEPDRTDAYNKEAAELAWERTLAFLKRSSV
jgi:carboxymethylenebutenolidase